MRVRALIKIEGASAQPRAYKKYSALRAPTAAHFYSLFFFIKDQKRRAAHFIEDFCANARLNFIGRQL